MEDFPAALEVRGLCKRYRHFTAVDEVSFSVGDGEVFGLLGPNGSGKSSTLHSITGVVEPTAGSITIGWADAGTPEAKRLTGFVPDDLALPTSLTGREYLALLASLHRTSSAERRDFLVDAFRLRPALGKLLGEYSHGMKRKLQLVGALLHAPRLLILVEPFQGLDPQATVMVRTIIELLTSDGGAVLVATHDLRAAQEYCGRVAILAAGRVVASGAPAALCEQHGRPSLEEVFLAVTGLEPATSAFRAALERLLRGEPAPVAGSLVAKAC